MMGKTHVCAGALLTAAAAPPINNVLGLGLSPAELAVGVCIGGVAGVLPDIDHPDSFITHGVIPGSKFFGPVGKLVGYLLCIPPRILGVGARATMNHRGGTHSVVFMLGWTLLAAPIYAAVFAGGVFLASLIWTPLAALLGIHATFQVGDVIHWLIANVPKIMPLVMLSVFLGYLAHLLTDSMTKVPVPWPWPFSKKRYHILPKGMRVTTDSFTENNMIRPLFFLLLIVVFALNIGIPAGKDAFSTVKTEVQQKTGQGHAKRTTEHQSKKSGNPAEDMPQNGKHNQTDMTQQTFSPTK